MTLTPPNIVKAFGQVQDSFYTPFDPKKEKSQAVAHIDGTYYKESSHHLYLNIDGGVESKVVRDLRSERTSFYKINQLISKILKDETYSSRDLLSIRSNFHDISQHFISKNRSIFQRIWFCLNGGYAQYETAIKLIHELQLKAQSLGAKVKTEKKEEPKKQEPVTVKTDPIQQITETKPTVIPEKKEEPKKPEPVKVEPEVRTETVAKTTLNQKEQDQMMTKIFDQYNSKKPEDKIPLSLMLQTLGKAKEVGNDPIKMQALLGVSLDQQNYSDVNPEKKEEPKKQEPVKVEPEVTAETDSKPIPNQEELNQMLQNMLGQYDSKKQEEGNPLDLLGNDLTLNLLKNMQEQHSIQKEVTSLKAIHEVLGITLDKKSSEYVDKEIKLDLGNDNVQSIATMKIKNNWHPSEFWGNLKQILVDHSVDGDFSVTFYNPKTTLKITWTQIEVAIFKDRIIGDFVNDSISYLLVKKN